ncbi:hypothetical protein LDL49_56250, partial [Nonomuraea sp. NEAU-L178]
RPTPRTRPHPKRERHPLGRPTSDFRSLKPRHPTRRSFPVTALEVIGVYGEPGRDPRGRVVSVAYLAIAPRLPEPIAGTDAAGACWMPAEHVLSARVELAFDHRRILADGVECARVKLEHTALGTAFCGETFTISELQQVYEAVWGVQLDPRNFYRKVQSAHGFIVAAGPMRRTENGRPARLFKAGPVQVLYPPMVRSAQSGPRRP